MLFESQWLAPREETLKLPDLPAELEDFTILHLSDIHAGQLGFNLRTLRKAVVWGGARRPDLVLLTGDILGAPRSRKRCVALLTQLNPPYGIFAVPGNHEYGLSKNPFATVTPPLDWNTEQITLLRDQCITVSKNRTEHGPTLRICGADYLTGGHSLTAEDVQNAGFPLLLTHRPPEPDDPLGQLFSLAFAGHTHGGQIRLPSPRGLLPLHQETLPYLCGVHSWGRGSLCISRGIGTTFAPFRLFTRPEVVLYRLTSHGA